MYAFILFGGASAWYLLYKYCCKNKQEVVDHPKHENVVETITETNRACCKLVRNKLVDETERHKNLLKKVHQEFNENYPKYLNHKVLQELNDNVDHDKSYDEEGSEISEESLWDDIG